MVPRQPADEEALVVRDATETENVSPPLSGAALVAEGIARVLKTDAAKAVEVLATERAALVAHAARLAADAADAAHSARESDAAGAAQKVARAAELSASLVQAQADATAARIKEAAAKAARDRAQAVSSGTLPDEAHQARALASEVRVAAEVTADETRRAAVLVATAVSAAASTVVYAREVIEHRLFNDVAAAAWTSEHHAEVTAGRVVRATATFSEGVALAAHEAAAAHLDHGESSTG